MILLILCAALQDARALVDAGSVKFNQGDYDGAIGEYTRAIQADPKFVTAYLYRGFAKQRKNDVDGSVADFNLALEVDPKFSQAFLARAVVKAAREDLDGAIADYTRAIENYAKYEDAWLGRANTNFMKWNVDAALADYTKLIEINPGNGKGWTGRGLARRAKGNLEGALADWNKAIAVDPKLPWAYYSRGCSLYDRREWAKAVADFRKACEMSAGADQSYSRLRLWLARCRLGQKEEATKDFNYYLKDRKPVKTGEIYPKTVEFLIGGLSEEDLLKAAESPREQEAKEKACEARYYAGSKCLLDGDKARAKEHFLKCVETGATIHSEYRSAQAELDALKQGK